MSLSDYDELDKRIIELLCRSSQGSYRQLAKQLDVHPTTLIQRVKNLEAKGVIQGYRASVDYMRLGFEYMGLVSIYADNVTTVQDEIIKIPQVISVFDVTGESDCVAWEGDQQDPRRPQDQHVGDPEHQEGSVLLHPADPRREMRADTDGCSGTCGSVLRTHMSPRLRGSVPGQEPPMPLSSAGIQVRSVRIPIRRTSSKAHPLMIFRRRNGPYGASCIRLAQGTRHPIPIPRTFTFVRIVRESNRPPWVRVMPSRIAPVRAHPLYRERIIATSLERNFHEKNKHLR